jgi:hypothetical protein
VSERDTMPPSYVCDGCMQRVTATEVGVWADFEHVLCWQCVGHERSQDT